MRIHESAENYLETILALSQKKQFVRSIDVVNEMNFSKPSVSVAMKHLREDGHIVMDENGYITLTDSGLEIANNIYERHKLHAGRKGSDFCCGHNRRRKSHCTL